MIPATNKSTPKELIPAGNYEARCYQMIHIGTCKEVIQGQEKMLNKVRISWELPTETKVFDPAKGEQPFSISKEFTLSMHEKATLRKMLASWRGKDFTIEEAKLFDVSKLVGVSCFLNVIHKLSKDGSKTYQEISSISALPKGYKAQKAINPPFILSYDDWSIEKFNQLPDFIRDRMKTSLEYKEMFEAQPMNHDRDILNGINRELAEDAYTSTDLPF